MPQGTIVGVGCDPLGLIGNYGIPKTVIKNEEKAMNTILLE